MSEIHDTGVIHGRFQILHNDHLKYLLAGKARCHRLVVGITDPDPVLSKQDSTDLNRTTREANPLTYFERFIMVTAALKEAGLSLESFCVVPFPIGFPKLYHFYVPMDAVFFMTICDQWGERKHELLMSRGLNVEVLWRRTPETKGITGSDIRRRMISGQPWEFLVPESAADLIRQWNIVERLKSLEGE